MVWHEIRPEDEDHVGIWDRPSFKVSFGFVCVSDGQTKKVISLCFSYLEKTTIGAYLVALVTRVWSVIDNTFGIVDIAVLTETFLVFRVEGVLYIYCI